MRIAMAVAAGLLLAGCGGSAPAGSGGPAAAPSAAGGPAAGAGQGTCPALKPGTPGVITLYCGGAATATVTVGGQTKQLRGGTCTTSAGLFVANLGVVTDHTFSGPRPDFVSVNSPPQGGSGQDVGASVILDGKFWGDSGRFGGTTTFSSGGRSVHFEGSASNGDHATIDVTC